MEMVSAEWLGRGGKDERWMVVLVCLANVTVLGMVGGCGVVEWGRVVW